MFTFLAFCSAIRLRFLRVIGGTFIRVIFAASPLLKTFLRLSLYECRFYRAFKERAFTCLSFTPHVRIKKKKTISVSRGRSACAQFVTTL